MSDVASFLIDVLETKIPSLQGKILRQNQRTPDYKINKKLQISLIQNAIKHYGTSTKTSRVLNAGYSETITIFSNELWSIQLICCTATDGTNQALLKSREVLSALKSSYAQKKQATYNLQLPRNPITTTVPSYVEGAEIVTLISIDMQIKTSDTFVYNDIDIIQPILDNNFQQ